MDLMVQDEFSLGMAPSTRFWGQIAILFFSGLTHFRSWWKLRELQEATVISDLILTHGSK